MNHTISPKIPADLLPESGNFGCGPAKIRPEQIENLYQQGKNLLGTSHRQAPIKNLVAKIQAGLTELYGLPDGYEVVLGNGGSTVFWDAATFSLVTNKAAHGSFGEFGNKFAQATNSAPFLAESNIHKVTPGTIALPDFAPDVDFYAWPQNETSTGAIAPVKRIAGSQETGALTAIDATSAAGGVAVDISETDVYYFAPQKAFSSDGGLWLAILSPDAIARTSKIAGSGRWIPQSLSLDVAITNSRANQTLNTPAIATLILLADQIEWILANGGLSWAHERCATSAQHLYDWATNSNFVSPFVTNPSERSTVVATIDFADNLDATQITKALRANNVVDVEPYRKLGRNQIRVGVFPSVEPSDVQKLIASIEYLIANGVGKK